METEEDWSTRTEFENKNSNARLLAFAFLTLYGANDWHELFPFVRSMAMWLVIASLSLQSTTRSWGLRHYPLAYSFLGKTPVLDLWLGGQTDLDIEKSEARGCRRLFSLKLLLLVFLFCFAFFFRFSWNLNTHNCSRKVVFSVYFYCWVCQVKSYW